MRSFRASFRGNGRPEKFTKKKTAFFNAKAPGKPEEKIHESSLGGQSKKQGGPARTPSYAIFQLGDHRASMGSTLSKSYASPVARTDIAEYFGLYVFKCPSSSFESQRLMMSDLMASKPPRSQAICWTGSNCVLSAQTKWDNQPKHRNNRKGGYRKLTFAHVHQTQRCVFFCTF